MGRGATAKEADELGKGPTGEASMTTKLAILEAREHQAQLKYENMLKRLTIREQEKVDIEKQYGALEKKWEDVNERYHLLLQKETEMQAQLQGSIAR